MKYGMYLEKLVIASKIEIIRTLYFKKGLNIITGELEEKEANNIGKTTVLRIIDFCLGAKSAKSIWGSNNGRSTNKELEKYIKNNKVYAKLTLKNDDKKYELKVDLFERGKKYIDGKSYTAKEYVQRLNDIVFSQQEDPTFRQLIGKFIRLRESNSGNFLKYIGGANIQNAIYRSVYEKLFHIVDPKDIQEQLRLIDEIKNIESDEKSLFRLQSIGDVEELERKLSEAEKLIDRKETDFQGLNGGGVQSKIIKQMNLLIKESNKFNEVSQQLLKLNQEIDILTFKKLNIQRIIDEENKRVDIDYRLLEEFYNELKESQFEIKRSFNELLEFNSSLKRESLKYYKRRAQKIEEQLVIKRQEKQELVETSKEIEIILQKIDSQTLKSKFIELAILNREKWILEHTREKYQNLLNNKENAQKSLDKLHSKKELKNLEKFNEYFEKNTADVLEQKLSIKYIRDSKRFPLEMTNYNQGEGRGVAKTISILFDISYVSLLNEVKWEYPHFFIYDILEDIDENYFQRIADLVRANGSQFIFAVLPEKIETYDWIFAEDIILRLNSQNKLFGI